MTLGKPKSAELGGLLMYNKLNMRSIGTGLSVVAAVIFALTFALYVEVSAKPNPSYGSVLGAASIGVVLLGLAAFAFRSGNSDTQFFELGVLQVSKKGRRVVEYDAVTELRYLMNARPWELSIVFRLGPGPDGRPQNDFKFTATTPSSGPHGTSWSNGENVRLRVERIVAARVHRALAARQAVPWGPDAVLTGAGLQVAGTTHPWRDIEAAEFNGKSGYMDVFAGGRRVVHFLHHDWNSWPGLLVIQGMMNQAKSGAARSTSRRVERQGGR